MKRKIISILLTLVLVLSFSLVTAVPVAAEVSSIVPTIEFVIGPTGGIVEWTTIEANSGFYSVELSTEGVPYTGELDYGEGRVIMSAEHLELTLADVTSFSFYWKSNAASGLPFPYFALDTTLDGALDGVADRWLIWNIGPPDDTSGATGWTQWSLSTAADNWHVAGPGGPYSDTGVWGDMVTSVGGTAEILSGRIAVGNGSTNLAEPVFVDDIEINGTTYDLEPRVINTTQTTGHNTIQSAIDAATASDTVNVAAGTYNEQVEIDKPLTLQGPNAVISPNPPGSRVEEAIITGESPLIRLPTDADVNSLTIEGFTFRDADSGGVDGSVILAHGGSDGWGNVTIRSNRFMNNYGPAIGVWALAGVNPADWEITDNLIDGVTGPSKSGIYLDLDTQDELGTGGFSGWEISNNTIKNTEYGGIMVHHAVDMVISGNIIEDVQKTGIQSSGIQGNVTITDNVITRAMLAQAEPFRAGIRLYGTNLDDEYGESQLIGSVWVTSNIVTNSYIGFATKSGHDYTAQEVHVNDNSFIGNSDAGLRHTGTGLLDATNNWWGAANGPGGVGSGDGDAVSTNVDYKPWLLTEGGDPIADVYSEYISLPDDWSLISPDRAWSDWEAMGATLIYSYGPAWGTPEQGSLISPLDALYIKTIGGGMMGVNYPEDDLGMFTTNLEVGWNLIGLPETYAGNGFRDLLSPLRYGAGDETALATLVSQGNYNPSGDSFYQATLGPADWNTELNGLLPDLYYFDGYWAYMNVAKEFGVIVVEGPQ